MLVFLISFLVLIFDQLTKVWAIKNFQGKSDLSLFGGKLKFTYLENRGAAFGILQGSQTFFFIVTIFVLGFLLYSLFRYKKSSRFFHITFGLIIGGALGNFIDRLRLNYVVDFIQIDFVDFYSFPIFNVADIGVTLGGLLIVFYLFFSKEGVDQ